MTPHIRKLKWERVDNSFDLKVTNPNEVDVNKLKILLTTVKDTKSWGRYFNKHASQEFHRWLDDLDTPLKEQAYARLSNWFLCDMQFIRETDLAKAALELWKAMFCTIPERRLTDPKRDDKILRGEFDLWWPKQQECQQNEAN